MPVLQAPDDLLNLREELRRREAAFARSTTIITVGAGTCGIAAGAREVLTAFEKSLAKHHIDAVLRTVGCIGFCAKEPLLDIRQGGGGQVFYGNVSPDMVERIVVEHVMKGHVVREWALGRLGADDAPDRSRA